MKFFVLILGLRLQKYSTNTKKYPPKKVLEALNLFSQFELPGKTRDGIVFTLPVTTRDESNFGTPPPFCGNLGWENKLRVPKTF